MQTILGCNGIIGTELAKALKNYTSSIRLVSRKPKKVNDTDEIFSADLLNAEQTSEAVKGSEIVYLTVGLPYKSKIWQQQWPVIMQNVIAACKQHKAKLVFFDNIYMYGPVNGIMTEETPFGATSKKGEVRSTISKMILDDVANGSLTAMICRAPEFYGPRNTLSGLNMMVFENIRKSKKAQWLLTDKMKRTFIYTPDAGKATALIANSPDTWNQTWHLPCVDSHPTGKEFMQIVSEVVGKEIKSTIISKPLLKLLSLFIPVLKESIELLYQNDRDYIFNSDKFKKAFPEFKITPYKSGISEIINERK
jgi:nucleoside-diphosphate-sugar epimerase